MAKKFRSLFITGFFFSVHFALVSYINSTALTSVVDKKYIGFFFTLGSLLSVLVLESTPRLIRLYGLKKIAQILLIFSPITLILLGTLEAKIPLLITFILYFSLNASILYCLDIFIEHYSDEHKTGNIRGLYLATINSAWVVAPALAGMITNSYGYTVVYILAAVMFIPAFFALRGSQRQYHDDTYKRVPFLQTIKMIMSRKALRTVTILNFMLHFFFVWMVIYLPLLLTKELSISWEQTGFIFAIMLLPFMLFQYPAGYLADTRLGEKELLIGGFIIAGIATILFARYAQSMSIVFIALTLFMTRVGASVIEIMCDTYFFKQLSSEETGAISVYRSMMPIAYIIGPLLGSLLLIEGESYTQVFSILGVLMILAGVYSFVLKDTK